MPISVGTRVLSRSQWPRGLRRGSAAARLLGMWVRTLPRHGCLSVVSVVCCQVQVSPSVWPLVQRSPTECGVPECHREASTLMRFWPTLGCWPMRNRMPIFVRKWPLQHTAAAYIILPHCLRTRYRRQCSRAYRHLLCHEKFVNTWISQVF